jgi:long-chain fatty acid transport protein
MCPFRPREEKHEMTRQTAVRPWTIAALGAALVSMGTDVHASGFQLVEQNASGLGNAYSGQAAAAEDASTIYFNPAGLTRLKGKYFQVSIEGIGPQTSFTDTGSTRPVIPTNPPTTIPVPLGGDGGDAGDLTPVPNAYLSWQVSERAWIGLGVNVPFGLKTDWDETWVGRFHAVQSEVKTININPTVAFQLSDAVSIGAGASYQHIEATLSSAVPYGGISLAASSQAGAAAPLAAAAILGQLGGPSGLAREGLSTVEGDTASWGWNVGLMFHPNDKFRLGVSYRSEIEHTLEGDVTFENAPSFSLPGPLAPLGAGINARFANGPVETTISLPQTVSVAGSLQASDKVQLLADWTWTGWDSIQDLTIDRENGSELSSLPLNFETTWRAGLGLNYQVNEKVKVRLGTAYDKAPVQDEFRTPRLPDQDRVWAAAGLQWKLGNGAFDFGYAHIFVDEATSNLRPSTSDVPSFFRGSLVGTYEASVNIVGLQYRHTF